MQKEDRLTKQVKARLERYGLQYIKHSDRYTSGVPDFFVYGPSGKEGEVIALFIELKKLDGKLSNSQRERALDLKLNMFPCWIVSHVSEIEKEKLPRFKIISGQLMNPNVFI